MRDLGMVEAIRQGDIPGVQLRVRQPLGITPEQAWTWLTDAGRLGRWLAQEARVETGPEGLLVLRTHDEATGRGIVERGRTLTFDQGRLWVLSFQREDAEWEAATRLSFEVTPGEGGCELGVFHQDFQLLSLSLCLTIWERYRKRWREALERLARAVAQGDPTA